MMQYFLLNSNVFALLLVASVIVKINLTKTEYSFEGNNNKSFLNSFREFRNSQASSRIVAGKKVGDTGPRGYPFPIPWDVAIIEIDRTARARSIICGGALLSNEYALSAAHCQPEASFVHRLLIGSTSKKDMFDENILHEISNHIIHDKYETFKALDAEFDIYDFMILKLTKSLNLCPNSFARLPPPYFKDAFLFGFLYGKILTVSGWGSMLEMSRERTKEIYTNPDKQIPRIAFPDHLRVAEVSYLRNKICQKRYLNFFTKEYADIKGSKDTLVKDLNFDTTTGSSMLCTSSCNSEDISECKNHRHSGTCSKDSGCKC